jgi:DNA ligase (NAD+)
MMNQLETVIKNAAQAYYDGNPFMSDAEFDELVEQLRKVDPTNPLLKTPGWGYYPTLGLKVNHLVTPIGSLDKIKEVDLEDKKGALPDKFWVQPKLDGGSAVAYYKKGKLWKIISRGDGIVGIDITENVKHAVPMRLKENVDAAIRGELVVTLEDFAETFEKNGYSSPRNTAVGLSQSEHVDRFTVKKIRFIVYDIVGSTQENYDIDISMKSGGFERVDSVYTSRDEFVSLDRKALLKTLNTLKDGKHVETDGLVLKKQRQNVIPQGEWFKFEHTYAMAYKFEEETAVTTVTGIEYNMSRTGRLVPTLLVQPVKLAGATIGRITGNNITYIVEKEAGVGAAIEVVRANEVIPKLQKTITPSDAFNLPTKCPACGEVLIEKGVDLFCDNPLCPPKSIESIYRLFDMMEVDGIGHTLIDTLLETLNINSLKGFQKFVSNHFRNIQTTLYNIFGGKTAEKFLTVIDKLMKYKPTIAEVLYTANIPSIGKTVSESYSAHIDAKEFIDTFKNNNEISDAWEQWSTNYLNIQNLKLYQDKVKEIMEFFGWELKEKVAANLGNLGWKVEVTGSVSVPRDEWFKRLKRFGIDHGSISKGTKFLVCNSPSSSSKTEKAKKLGIDIINENDFYLKIAKELNIATVDFSVQ